MKYNLTTERARRTVQLGVEAHRLEMLWLAAVSVLIGLTMITTGAPNFLEDWFSPWSRVVLGSLAFAPGLCTVVGLLTGSRRMCGWWLQVLGLLGQAVWYFSMMSVYILLLRVEGPQFVRLGEHLSSEVSGRGYVPLVYAGLLGLAVIPLSTLLRLGPPNR